MPITVSAPHGVLTAAGEKAVLPRLTEAVLEITGAVAHPFFGSIVGGHVELLPPGSVYAGGANRPLVVVKLEVPNVAFSTTEARAAFIEAATRIVGECSEPGHERSDTWVTIWNAPDGAWGIGGVAYTNDALIAAAS
jgi:phenylpyruvate tautomerase PptA (4-oxalocrotonate tautomerase family)